MKAIRRVLALLLTVSLLLGASTVALAKDRNKDRDDVRGEIKIELKGKNKFEAKFRDWQGAFWANEALARLITKGVISGSVDNGVLNIAPQRHVTRLEAAIMLIRVLGLEKEAFLAPPVIEKIEIENGKLEIEFEDRHGVPAWGRAATWLALKKGFFPYDGKQLNWNKPLSRLDAAVMLVKASGLDAEARAQAGTELEFADSAAIPAAARGYVKVAVEQGLVTGYPDNTFQPNNKLTRAEWATLLDRLDRKDSKDPRQVKGTVTGISAAVYGGLPGISMTTPVFPNGVTYPVDDTAVFYVNRQEATINDIKVGDQVLVQLSEDRKIVMVTVVADAPVIRTITGSVTAKTAGGDSERPTLTVAEGVYGTDAKTYQVADYAVITGPDGSAANFSQIEVGSRVKVRVENGLIVRIRILNPEPVPQPAPSEPLTQGAITGVTLSAGVPAVISIRGADGQASASYQVAANATLTFNGQALTVDDLKIGDQVSLTLSDSVITAVSVTSRVQ